MADEATSRDRRGRFSNKKVINDKESNRNVIIEHNYSAGDVCDGIDCSKSTCNICFHHVPVDKRPNTYWKEGRRVVEFEVLLSKLQVCEKYRLGPVPLTYNNITGEIKKGLGGYLYVKCQNIDCGHTNCVPYGATYRRKITGMPCFSVNTKLGTAMIDNLGGPKRVNNMLSTLNLPTINDARLKEMERRAGDAVEKIAERSSRIAAKEAFHEEMQDIANIESEEVGHSMEGLIEDLGVAAMAESSPNIKDIIQSYEVPVVEREEDWTDDEDFDKEEGRLRLNN